MANDVFLSYARTDIARARQIKDLLEGLGLTVFFDTEGLDGGDVFPDVLDHEVKHAGAVVGVWSKHALTRPWVKIECDIGKTRGVLVPLQIEQIAELDRPAAFWNIQFADLSDFSGDTDHIGWQGFVRSLARTLGRDDLLKTESLADTVAAQSGSAFGELPTSDLGGLKHPPVKPRDPYNTVQSKGLPILIAVLISAVLWYAMGWAIGMWIIQPQIKSMIDAGEQPAQIGLLVTVFASLSGFVRTFLACLFAKFLAGGRASAAWLTILAVSVILIGGAILHTFTLVSKLDAPIGDILPQQVLSAVIGIVLAIFAGMIAALIPFGQRSPPPT